MSESRPGILSRLFSDEWRLPIAMATGVALLIGHSLLVLVDESMGRWSAGFHSAGHALVWVSLMLGAIHGVRAAWESIAELKPNIDVLMVVGAGLAAMIGHAGEGALLLFMFTLAGALEHRAMAKAKDAVSRLHKLMPEEALKRTNGAGGERWEAVRPEELAAGDVVLVRAGETVPADGDIVDGHSTVDQSTLTGESLPRAVDVGDRVFAGTMNQNGALTVRVTRPVAESSLQRILELVIEAQGKRQPLQRVIDKFSTPYTVAVFFFAGLTLAYFGLLHRVDGERMAFSDAAYRAITLLIVASPCALVIATPTATLCGLNRAARAGLLVKGGDALERLARVSAVAVDKTGTLTAGELRVVDVHGLGGADVKALLPVARAVEERSTHPIAVAIAEYAHGLGAVSATIGAFEMVAGMGISAESGGEPVAIGTLEFVAPMLDGAARACVESLVGEVRGRGAISAAMRWGDRCAVFELADTERLGAESFVHELRRSGVGRVVMLTGDHKVIAERLAERFGITEVHADLLPEEKVDRLREIREQMRESPGAGGLAVIGDGVNDAPALATADVGLAMGGVGADATLETADVVILNDDLLVAPWGFRLARRARLVMFINLWFALAVIASLATFALLGLIPMGVGVIGHEGSTLLVVANSLQLLGFAGPRP
ncbi:MAG: cation-translocating P-type ATPase [Phycisphaeraceae bacterium]|nr:cation-translocating P-type ATPase [Phycisphaeraceae bacterium]MCB9847117.1 cation-translocating P-type ATPase [Phycisphaeraceae bacterium]